MRTIALAVASVLLTGCATTVVEKPADLGAASADAAARAEFTIVPEADRAPFPVWSTQDLDGYAWNTTNLGRSVTVVNFWASWCEPCREEWPELQAAAEGHPSVRFVGINSQDDLAAARGFIRNHPTDYRQLQDATAFVLKSLQGMPNSTLPTTVILDRDHRVAAWKSGPALRGQIRRALAALRQR
jgi:thiol-disulfide isomerase/thioredoxin